MFLWGFLFGFFVFLLLFLFSTKLSPEQLEFPHYQLLRHYKLFDLVILWYKKRESEKQEEEMQMYSNPEAKSDLQRCVLQRTGV